MIPFNSAPFNSLLRKRGSSKTFFEALGLWLSSSLSSPVRPYFRPQGDEGDLFLWRCDSRDYYYSHTGNEGIAWSGLILAANSSLHSRALEMSLEAREVVDLFEGVISGHTIREIASRETTSRVSPESKNGGYRYEVATSYLILHEVRP